MKRILIFSTIILALCNTLCSKQRKLGKVICEGFIYDSIGGKGAEGVSVALYACNPHDGRNFCATFRLGSTVTDGLGYYKIIEKPARSDRYYISGKGIKYQEINESDLRNSTYTTGYLKK